jgi:serine/threonine protein kinase
MNERCQIKICEFGFSRISNPFRISNGLPGKFETRYYRVPEALLSYGSNGSEIDVWSVDLILAEIILSKPLLPERDQMDQLHLIHWLLEKPSEYDIQNLKSGGTRDFIHSMPESATQFFSNYFQILIKMSYMGSFTKNWR